MLWIITILLALILIAILGLGPVVLFLVLAAYALFAIGQGDTEQTMYAAGLIFSSFLGACIASVAYQRLIDPSRKICPYCAEPIKFNASVCKHCGREQQVTKRQSLISRQSLARQFRMPDWNHMTLRDYASAGAMVIGVALIGFLALYVLIPQ